MKCEMHPDEDALGMCVSCCRGVCAICKVNYQGLMHCKQCIEAGRIGGARLPAAGPPGASAAYGMPFPYQYFNPSFMRAAPNPRGEPDGRLFKVGAIGAGAAGVLSVLTGAVFLLEGPEFSFYYGSHTFTFIAGTLLAIAQLTTAVGFFGFFRNYGPLSGAAGAGLLAICGFLLLLFFGAASQDFGNAVAWMYIGGLTQGVGQIVAGGALLDNRRFLDNRALALAAGMFIIVAGSLMAGLIGLYLIGWICGGIGYVLLSVTMFGAPVPGSKGESAGPAPEAR